MKIILLNNLARLYDRWLSRIPVLKRKIIMQMKLISIFMFLGLMQVYANSFGQITLNERNVSLVKILNSIEKQSGYVFFYNDADVKKVTGISVQVKNVSIESALDVALKDMHLSYRIDQKDVLIRESLPAQHSDLLTPTIQQRNVSGRITDEDGRGISGVNIRVKGSSNTSISNENGEYQLSISGTDVVLQYSFVGYISQEIPVGEKSIINVSLVNSISGLEEVAVVGYGTQKKRLITGATVQVSGEDIEKLNAVDILGALQSQSPGVNIVSSSGMPGEGFKVNIRGLGTTGNSSPLYVIDGVAGGDIQNLNQSDIESIDILKDAASAAIYGTRAANGVILITTKQGKQGKPKISYDTHYGFQNPYKMLTPLSAKEYMAIQNEVNFNESSPAFDYEGKLPVIYKQVMNGTFNGTNWMDEIRNKNALVSSHAVNITGGTELSTFSLGFSNTSQDGILGKQADPSYERYTARINSDYVLFKAKTFDIVKIGENLMYTNKLKSGIGISDIYWNDIKNMLTTSPLLPAYNKDGGYYDQANKIEDEWNMEGTTYNPIAEMDYRRGRNKNKEYSLHANVYVEIQPIENLKLRSSYGYKKQDGSYRQYVPIYTLSSTNGNANDRIDQSEFNGYGWTLDNTLSYMFQIDEKHNFDAVLGQSLEKDGLGESVGAGNSGAKFPGSFEHAWITNTTGSANDLSVSGGPWGRSSLASFFGRVNYNLDETYLASVIFRADGSSNFASGHRWGYFPSFSAGWVVTNEKFMEPVKGFMNFFKLRGGWGQNGNSSIGAFSWAAKVDLSYLYGFGLNKDQIYPAAFLRKLPNPNLGWETSEQTNIGLDSRFFNSRLELTLDWYKKETKDWLVTPEGLDTWGTGSPSINGGKIRNSGVELALSWRDKKQDFSYGFNLNAASNKNKVLAIENGRGLIHGPSNVLIDGTPEIFRAQVGYPLAYFWGYETAGIFQNAEQLVNTPVKLNGAKPGDVIFVDQDANGVIDERDKKQIGNPHPKLTLGFSVNFAWKGADLAITTFGAFGHQNARSIRSLNTQQIFQRWHGEGTSDHFPRLTNTSHPNWNYFSDIHIENADYLKVQNITFGYDFKRVLPKLPLAQARLFVAGQNLFTITGYSGMDPEIGYSAGTSWSRGVDLGFYPSPRVIMFGANLKF